MFEQHDAISVEMAKTPLATLLLADGNGDDLRTVATELTHLGYHVIKVIDGQQLLSIIGTLNIDVILIDTELAYDLQAEYSIANVSYHSENGIKASVQSVVPAANEQFNGYTLCRMLSQEIESMYIPTILLGTDDHVEARIQSLESNAWYYVQKPPEMAELHLQLQSILTRVKAHRSLQDQSRHLEEMSMRCTEELKGERAKRRRSEERINRLLETIQLQNQQLQLLAKLTMRQPDNNSSLAERQMLFDEQMLVLQEYLDQLTTLALTFQEELNPQTISLLKSQLESTRRDMPKGDYEQSRSIRAQQHRFQRSNNGPTGEQHRLFSPLSQLSEREYEVMLQLVEGNSYQEIAENFRISPSTVRSYRSRIMQKLGLSNSTEMIKLAVRYGLISIR